MSQGSMLAARDAHYVVAVDASPVAKTIMQWTANKLCRTQQDVMHLVHSYQPLTALASDTTQYFPSGECVCVRGYSGIRRHPV